MHSEQRFNCYLEIYSANAVCREWFSLPALYFLLILALQYIKLKIKGKTQGSALPSGLAQLQPSAGSLAHKGEQTSGPRSSTPIESVGQGMPRHLHAS